MISLPWLRISTKTPWKTLLFNHETLKTSLPTPRTRLECLGLHFLSTLPGEPRPVCPHAGKRKKRKQSTEGSESLPWMCNKDDTEPSQDTWSNRGSARLLSAESNPTIEQPFYISATDCERQWHFFKNTICNYTETCTYLGISLTEDVLEVYREMY